MTAANPGRPKVVKFLADVCWLGPIIGAPCDRDHVRVVRIAGAEDPALGKSFGAVLLPVEEAAGHFHPVGGIPKAVDVRSDRNGWFSVEPETGAWAGAEGMLVVLLYNQSRDLEYYSFPDYKDPTTVAIKDLSACRSHARILKPMPKETYDMISQAIDEAIHELLKTPAKDLRKGVAVVRPAATVAQVVSACDQEPGATLQPPARAAELAIAVASCQYPTAMLESVIAGASYARLAERLRKPHPPQCLLLVGDQIYVDGTAGFFDPTSQFDRFVRPYEILFRMEAVREVRRQLPVFAMMDDHEVQDNWEPRVDDVRTDPVMIRGRKSYLDFQRRAGPDRQPPVEDSRCPLWYPFEVNGFPLFMTDTRTERTARVARTKGTKRTDPAQPERTDLAQPKCADPAEPANRREREIENARIMSVGQMKALLDWLSRQPQDVPKIVASPAILLPRHARAVARMVAISARAVHSDGWDGYPNSLYQVLAHIARNRIPNVVFVSGDEHLSCVARIELRVPDGDPVLVHSVHCSPLFAPFPFANTLRADLLADDDFDFPAGEADAEVKGSVGENDACIKCSVETRFAPPGDGVALLRFYHDGVGWKMNCEFDRAHEEGGVITTFKRSLANLSRRETRR